MVWSSSRQKLKVSYIRFSDSVIHPEQIQHEKKWIALFKIIKLSHAQLYIKTALLKHITDLRAERTTLIDRFNVVLNELKAKGGETEEYDTYIDE